MQSAQALLAQAKTSFERGELAPALAALRALPRDGLAPTERMAAERLHGLAAFRLGEMAEAAERLEALLPHLDPGRSATLQDHFDLLGVAVIASGELGHYENTLTRLRELLGLAGRLGGAVPWVRARGSSATAFALLGDVWAARQIMADLVQELPQLGLEPRLAYTVHNNHASVCLLLARAAREGGDDEADRAALAQAEPSIRACVELSARLNDERLTAFSRLHQVEWQFLGGERGVCTEPLTQARALAATAGLRGHWRQLGLLEAEIALAEGRPADALATLLALQAGYGEGHDLGGRIRLAALLSRAHRAAGQAEPALEADELWQRLQAVRAYRQGRVQSAMMRTRLELEYLFQRSARVAQ